MLKFYLKQENVPTPHSHNIILFELDFNIKFSLIRLSQFLSDLKNFILCLSGNYIKDVTYKVGINYL